MSKVVAKLPLAVMVCALSFAAMPAAFAEDNAPERTIFEICGIDEKKFENATAADMDSEEFRQGVDCIQKEATRQMAEASKEMGEVIGELRKTPLGGIFEAVLGQLMKEATKPSESGPAAKTEPDAGQTAQVAKQDARATPDPCQLKLKEGVDNNGVTAKMLNLLQAKDEASAYQKFSQKFKASAPEIGFANHIDMLMWPGRRLSDAQGVTSTTVTSAACTGGKISISEQSTVSLDGAPAADVVIETVDEDGVWKIDSINVLKQHALVKP